MTELLGPDGEPRFIGFPKMPRLNRECIITEKIDGTNAAIAIHRNADDGVLDVWAQSRSRIITPGSDNFGFAGWVCQNQGGLATLLGEGIHFGEWWGSGIQRRYNMTEKRFSLFNVDRWAPAQEPFDWPRKIPSLGVVPLLWRGEFDSVYVELVLHELKVSGSKAAPGFTQPEGIVVWHIAAGHGFKLTFDDQPKGASNASSRA